MATSGKMDDLPLLHVDLVASAVGEGAIGGGRLFIRRETQRVAPFGAVRVDEIGAHVAIPLIHEEALASRTE